MEIDVLFAARVWWMFVLRVAGRHRQTGLGRQIVGMVALLEWFDEEEEEKVRCTRVGSRLGIHASSSTWWCVK